MTVCFRGVFFAKLFTQRRSTAERSGCFQRRQLVSLSICLFVNATTSERLNIGDDETWRLGALYKNLVRVRIWGSEVKGQGHQGQKKNKKVRHFFGSSPRGRELCRPPVLRRWENQRMLSSFSIEMNY